MSFAINSKRLLQNIQSMAQIGATERGGCNRLALTDLDVEARALFASWCRSFDLGISYDAVGNMFVRFDGNDTSAAPLAIGSHLDTQETGGKYDGILGVLAGLEVICVLKENNLKPERPIELACWTNEEGARFAPAMMGSGVFSGELDLNKVSRATDAQGISVGQELNRHGYSGNAHPTTKRFHGYLELHIEQGPILEQHEKAIGIVTGAQGIRWFDVSITGQEAHAGPFPMSMRKDPTFVLPDLLNGVQELGRFDSKARATVGQIRVFPGSRNVVPGQIDITIDLRHPDECVLTAMHEELEKKISGLASDNPSLGFKTSLVWHSPVVAFDPGLIGAVRRSVAAHGYGHLDIVSGAGHDALMVARRVPTSMIFIPCRDGLSHNEAEHAEPDHIAAGANVLLGAVCELLGITIPRVSKN